MPKTNRRSQKGHTETKKAEKAPPATVVVEARELIGSAKANSREVTVVAGILARYDAEMSRVASANGNFEELFAVTVKHAEDIVAAMEAMKK